MLAHAQVRKAVWSWYRGHRMGKPVPIMDVDPVVEAYKPGIDVSLIERNLRLTPEERLRQLMQLQRFADELRHAGARLVPKR